LPACGKIINQSRLNTTIEEVNESEGVKIREGDLPAVGHCTELDKERKNYKSDPGNWNNPGERGLHN